MACRVIDEIAWAKTPLPADVARDCLGERPIDKNGSIDSEAASSRPMGWKEKVEAAFFTLYFAAIVGIATALGVAMAFALFSLDFEGAANGLAVMMYGILFDGSILAGLVAGTTALVKLFTDRRRALPSALAVGLLFFLVYTLVPMLDGAIAMSSWGSSIGFVLGAPLGARMGIKQAVIERQVRRGDSHEGRESFGFSKLFKMSWDDWKAL